MAQMRGSLKDFCRVKKNTLVRALEIGVCTGENAKLIYDTLNIDKLFLMDMWDKSYHQDVYRWACSAFSKFEGYQDVIFIKGNAIHLHDLIRDNTIDYLYIDDNHSPGHVEQELLYYLPKVTSTGMIAGHDYDITKPDRVKKAVDGFFANRNIPGTKSPYIIKTDQETLDWWVWMI